LARCRRLLWQVDVAQRLAHPIEKHGAHELGLSKLVREANSAIVLDRDFYLAES
jgi:hypothetical protein